MNLILGNLAQTYNLKENHIDQDNPLLVILEVAVISVHYTIHTFKGYNLGQLLFERDMFILIEHLADCKLIRQRKQA